MTSTITMSVSDAEKTGVNIYKIDRETGNVIEDLTINPGETHHVTVWREVFIEIYENCGVGGTVEV